MKIAQANRDAQLAKTTAAEADQRAGVANQKAESIAAANQNLHLEVLKQEADAKTTKDELIAQTEKVNVFAQGLSQQQQGMAHQMQVTLAINDMQVETIASRLRLHAGQKISVHTMMDARSQRLAMQFIKAFGLAGLDITGNSTDMGPNYTGVMIAVHDPSPAPHPPLADALSDALQSMGIPITKVADASVKSGEVAVYIGPQ